QSLRASREEAARVSGEMASKVAVLEERRLATSASLQRIETMTAEVETRLQSLVTQIASAGAEKQQRISENQSLGQQMEQWRVEAEALQTSAAALHLESDNLRQPLAESEAQLKAVRGELDAARDRRGELAAVAAKMQSDLEHMAETCRNELNI